MHRRLLAATMTLGLLVTAVGMSGIFAIFEDQATTGDNTVTSGDEGRVADIKLATAMSTLDCATADYVDNLTTGLINATDVRPGWTSVDVNLCLRNVGSATVALSWKLIDVVHEDVACTGDEGAAGDTTCGDGVGELGPVLRVEQVKRTCSTGAQDGSPLSGTFDYYEEFGAAPGTIAANETQCFSFRAFYPDDTDPMDAQLAQSDRVTWKFAFDATQFIPTP